MSGNYRNVRDAPFIPVGAHASDATLAAATVLAPPAGATRLRLQVFAQAIRYTLDGTTPTATLGFALAAGETIEIALAPGVAVAVIEEVAGGIVQYQWGQ